MRITALATYPVKGCHRLAHETVAVRPWGLAGDRRWMLVDADGVGVTQREAPHLSGLTARPVPGGLELSAPGRPPLRVDEPVAGPEVLARVFRHQPPVPVRLAESAWSSAFLGRDARLVWLAEPAPDGPAADRPAADGPDGREGAREDERHGDRVTLADGAPVLLAGEASLDALNDWLAEAGEEAVPMSRFRPNVVIGGAPPWAEDEWVGGRVRLGEVVCRVVAACARCLVTTIDQDTGQVGREPLRMLGRRRRFDAGLLFAVQLVPETTGRLRVGDPVTAALVES